MKNYKIEKEEIPSIVVGKNIYKVSHIDNNALICLIVGDGLLKREIIEFIEDINPDGYYTRVENTYHSNDNNRISFSVNIPYMDLNRVYTMEMEYRYIYLLSPFSYHFEYAEYGQVHVLSGSFHLLSINPTTGFEEMEYGEKFDFIDRIIKHTIDNHGFTHANVVKLYNEYKITSNRKVTYIPTNENNNILGGSYDLQTMKQYKYEMDNSYCLVCSRNYLKADKRYQLVGNKMVCDGCHFRLVNCYVCDKVIRKNKLMLRTIDNKRVCPECIEKKRYICESCGIIHKETNFLGRYSYCGDCIDDITTCNDCGEHINTSSENYEEVDGKTFCIECFHDNFFVCECCGELFEIGIDEVFDDGMGNPICNDCFSDNFFVCSNCQVVVPNEYEYFNERTNTSYCEQCFCNIQDLRILEYHDGVDWKFKGNPKNNRYYGMEIELKWNNSSIELLDDLDDTFGINEMVYMEDCSLRNEGFEVITHPSSFELLKTQLVKFDDITSCHTDRDTGVHIHVSRKSISELTLAKLMLFMCQNKRFIEDIAERSPNDFWTHEKKDLICAKVKNGKYYNRFMALNCQNNHTIEFRMFAGSSESNTLIKNLEFVESLIRFCEVTGLSKLDEDNFTDYIKKNQKKYNKLFDFIDNLYLEVE
jgi:hypothetical protein